MQISEATAFLENAYVALNNKFFQGQLPPVIITIQSSPRAYGHYTTWDAWHEGEEGYREINLGAETLSQPIENLMAVMIHEMTHHYCAVISNQKDTSRGNTYHNKIFKQVAESTGAVIIGYDPRMGYSPTTPSDALIAFVEEQGWKDVDLSRNTPERATRGRNNGVRKLVCPECGCSVRATKEVHIACMSHDSPIEMVLEEK